MAGHQLSLPLGLIYITGWVNWRREETIWISENLLIFTGFINRRMGD
jgi:hypothetical protein